MTQETKTGLSALFFRAVRGDCAMRKTLWLGLLLGTFVWAMIFVIAGYVFRLAPSASTAELIGGCCLLGIAGLLYLWAFLLTFGVVRSAKREKTAAKTEAGIILVIFWLVLFALFAGFVHIVMFI
jgi:hypothetical protein